ncbi:MAG: methyltransferase domain-containing protein [Dehalococcoidia bacterium]|jgi:ubiquinone/menaquinone biosynthesis C-methylase UbiE
MNEFDWKALKWDNDPMTIERAKRVADVIEKYVSLSKDMNAYEYGCGTSLLSFNLFPYLKSIRLADSSEGMLKILEEKIKKNNIDNMTIEKIDLTVESPSNLEAHDIIYTLMTLHHIPDTDAILKLFYKILKKPGYLCIADLDREDGSFHGEGFIGHNGFDREDLSKKLESIGFMNIKSEICFQIPKKHGDTVVKLYPLFVMVAQKL